MESVDDVRALHSKGRLKTAIELILERLQAMFAITPIIGNIIGLGLAMFALYYIRHEIDLAGFGHYRNYFGIGIEIFGALQVIKSGTRSLTLPLVALVGGSIIAHSIPHGQMVMGFGRDFYEQLMIVGIVGIGASVLTIS